MRLGGRWRWAGLAALVSLLMVAVCFPFAEPVVTLADGSRLRVLQATFGMDHSYSVEGRWKRRLLSRLPLKWQTSFFAPVSPATIQTRHDSLVLWLEQRDPVKGLLAAPRSLLVEAVLPDGSRAAGVWRTSPGGTLGTLSFSTYARTEQNIPFRVADGNREHSLRVPNPHPAEPQEWPAKPLPQTSAAPHLEIVLNTLSLWTNSQSHETGLQARFAPRAIGDGALGWMTWRGTLADTAGNWQESAPGAFGNPLRWSPFPTAFAPWKITVEPVEILSAGMVARPLAGSVEKGLLSSRAHALGIRNAWVLGAGVYQVTMDTVTPVPDASQATIPVMRAFFLPIGSGTNWTLQLVTAHPGVLSVRDLPGLQIQARIRERLPGKEGRLFPRLASAGTRVGGAGGTPVMSADFYATRLPDDAGNLEAELLLSHPPMEFLTGPPGQSGGRMR